jgi:serine/threonine protein kinase
MESHSNVESHVRYRKIRFINGGVSGKVYEGLDTITGQTVAMKRISLKEEREGIPSTTIREIALLKELKHENIVRLLDIVHSKSSIYVVLEYIDGNLKSLIEEKKTGLDPKLVKV